MVRERHAVPRNYLPMADPLLDFLLQRAEHQAEGSANVVPVHHRKPAAPLRPLIERMAKGQWPGVDLGYTQFRAEHFDTFDDTLDRMSSSGVDLDHLAGAFRPAYGVVLAKTRDGGSVIGVQWDPKANKRGGYRWVDIFVEEQTIASYSGEDYVEWLRDIERDMAQGGYTDDFKALMKMAGKRPKKL